MSTLKRHFRQAYHMRVQIGLTSCKGDFDLVVVHLVNFIEIRSHVFGCEIDKMIGCRAALNIAIGAFNIAKRSRVKPQGLKLFEKDRGPFFTFGGDGRILEFTGIDRRVHDMALTRKLLTVIHNRVKAVERFVAIRPYKRSSFVRTGVNLSLNPHYSVTELS